MVAEKVAISSDDEAPEEVQTFDAQVEDEKHTQAVESALAKLDEQRKAKAKRRKEREALRKANKAEATATTTAVAENTTEQDDDGDGTATDPGNNLLPQGLLDEASHAVSKKKATRRNAKKLRKLRVQGVDESHDPVETFVNGVRVVHAGRQSSRKTISKRKGKTAEQFLKNTLYGDRVRRVSSSSLVRQRAAQSAIQKRR